MILTADGIAVVEIDFFGRPGQRASKIKDCLGVVVPGEMDECHVSMTPKASRGRNRHAGKL